MSFLLKIVQGPNAGAEIALVKGVTLSVGSGDACDIVLSDASVPERAFELEVTDERVVAVMPGGKDVKLEPFRVTWLGTTAVAMGPDAGAWKELVWPEAEKTKASADEPSEEPDESSAETPAAPHKRRSFGCFFAMLVLLALAGAIGWAVWKYPKQSMEYVGKAWTWTVKAYDVCREKAVGREPPPPPPPETLAQAAGACGFTVRGTGGRASVTGDFKTRAERLEATARAYAAQPGVTVDFTDAESLANAVNELLALVSDGKVKLDRVVGRKVFLSGYVASQTALRKILESLSTDVPKVSGADCAGVTVGGIDVSSGTEKDAEEASDAPRYKVPRMKAVRAEVKPAAPAHPVMPVAGILTVPYPCLVLSDGTRAMEGARFGDYVIEKIEADRVTVRGAEGPFVWRP